MCEMEVHVPQGKGLFLAWFAAFFQKFGSIDFNGEMAY